METSDGTAAADDRRGPVNVPPSEQSLLRTSRLRLCKMRGSVPFRARPDPRDRSMSIATAHGSIAGDDRAATPDRRIALESAPRYGAPWRSSPAAGGASAARGQGLRRRRGRGRTGRPLRERAGQHRRAHRGDRRHRGRRGRGRHCRCRMAATVADLRRRTDRSHHPGVGGGDGPLPPATGSATWLVGQTTAAMPKATTDRPAAATPAGMSGRTLRDGRRKGRAAGMRVLVCRLRRERVGRGSWLRMCQEDIQLPCTRSPPAQAPCGGRELS